MLLDLGVTIDRPVEDVFAYIRDVDEQQHGEQVASIEKVTPGPTSVGTQWREVVRMPFRRRGEVMLEITEMEPPCRLTTSFRGPVMRGEIAYTLTPTDTGTRLDQSEEITYTGWAWPANILGRRALHTKVRRRLNGFKAQLEL